MPHDLRKYAVHEAGHCLFNYVNGCRLVSVSVSPDGMNNVTLINHPIFKRLHQISYTHILMKKWVGGLLAGPAAEMYLDNGLWKELPSFLEDDICLAMQSMKSRGWSPPNGCTPGQFFKDYGCTSGQFFKDWGSWARCFTISRWREISLLADELERKLKLSGVECAKFLESIWPEPLPPGVLPWQEHKS